MFTRQVEKGAKHLELPDVDAVEAAEFRIRESVLRRERGESWDYEGRDEDLALIRRKRHELGPERLGGGDGG